MKLKFSERADREIESALEWWRENRLDAPRLLRDELDEYFDKLKKSPDLGEPWGTRRGVLIRKVLLRRTKKKLYTMREAPGVLRILCFWGGERGRDPKL